MLSTSSCPWILEKEASHLVSINPLPSTGFQSVSPDRICFCCFVFFFVFQGLTLSLQLLQPQTTGSPLHFSFVILFLFLFLLHFPTFGPPGAIRLDNICRNYQPNGAMEPSVFFLFSFAGFLTV